MPYIAERTVPWYINKVSLNESNIFHLFPLTCESCHLIHFHSMTHIDSSRLQETKFLFSVSALYKEMKSELVLSSVYNHTKKQTPGGNCLVLDEATYSSAFLPISLAHYTSLHHMSL